MGRGGGSVCCWEGGNGGPLGRGEDEREGVVFLP